MNFVIMGDENYFETIAISVDRIRAIYPDAGIYFYDWGIEAQNIEKLRTKAVHVIDWTSQIAAIRAKKYEDQISQKSLYNYVIRENNKLKKKIKKKVYKKKFPQFLYKKLVNQALVFEHLLLEKINCMAHMSGQVGAAPFVFLDADAILMQNIDEVYAGDLDLGVTLRRKNELNFDTDACHALNSGVIFFGPDQAKRDAILTRWSQMAQASTEYLREQTAMTRLLETKLDSSAFDYDAKVRLEIDEMVIKAKILACEQYNFTWIDELFDGSSAIDDKRVIHFKGREHLEYVQKILERTR